MPEAAARFVLYGQMGLVDDHSVPMEDPDRADPGTDGENMAERPRPERRGNFKALVELLSMKDVRGMRRNMESTKEFQEETRRYFDRLAKDYDDSCDGRFVRCMYREVIRRAVSCRGTRSAGQRLRQRHLIRMLGEVK